MLVRYFAGPQRNMRNCGSHCCPQRGEWFSGDKQQCQEQRSEPLFLKAAQLSRCHMGFLYWFFLCTGWTRSKKQHNKASTWVSILWFRLYTVQNQIQWNLTSFQAKVLFLREVATGSTGHIHCFQPQMGRIQPLNESYSKALNTVNFRHYPIKQQLTQNKKSRSIKARALARSLKRSTIKCTDISAHRHAYTTYRT